MNGAVPTIETEKLYVTKGNLICGILNDECCASARAKEMKHLGPSRIMCVEKGRCFRYCTNNYASIVSGEV